MDDEQRRRAPSREAPAGPPSAGPSPLDVDEAVFDAVERIPAGRVSTYGAIGRLVGVGPRRVARALSQGGGAVPWHRVVRADGSVAEPVRVRQLALLAAEGVPVRAGRVDLAAVGWPD
ncbi:MGMT family protein [Geodermatophilus sp. URMC 60]